MSGNVSDVARSNPDEPHRSLEGSDPLKSSATESQDVQVEGGSQVPPSDVGGMQPARAKGDGAQQAPVPVQHDNDTCYLSGCDRIAQASQMSEDGKIHRVCAEHKKPAVVLTAVTRAEHCEHAGCERTPRYGVQGGPLSFCQGHKRAGMYTCRDGELFVATRDGSALRGTSGASGAATASRAGAAPGTTTASEAAASSGAAASSLVAASSGAAATPDTSTHTPDPAPPQEPKNDLSMLVLPRKLCEEPGCESQPSYGVPGSGMPQYCSTHKKDGLVSLKNRPCVEPGCNTRPHYGMSKGRAVYCVTHKLEGMVHLLKEAKNLEKEAHAMRRRKSRLNIAAKKAAAKKTRMEQAARMGRVEATDDTPAQGSEDGGGEGGSQETLAQEEEEGDRGNRENNNKGKRPARAKGVPRKSTIPAEAPQTKARETAGAATGKPSSPPSSAPASSPRTASGPRQKKPSASRPEDPAELAPSDEMRLFQEARELARASAQASGSGRRARAPSRKLLEASGKLAGGSAQWMTKEKKEEHARRTQEIKEQRKAAAAAGLKLGHVIETITLPSANDVADAGAAGGGSDDGGGSGGATSSSSSLSGVTSSSPTSIGATSSSPTSIGAISSSPASGNSPSSGAASSGGFSSDAASSGGFPSEEAPTAARAFGRQISPAQIEVGAGKPPASGGAEQSPPCSRNSTENANGEGIANEQERSVAPAAAAEAASVSGKRWNSIASEIELDEARASKRSRHADGDAESDGSREKSGKTACESENCLKTAKYGINGIVRYCKKHHIFGMQKIVHEQ